VEQQEALTLIRARDLLVRLRTAAVNAVRGLTKSCGYRMPASSTRCFAKRSLAVMPPGLAQALGPVLEQIAEMTAKIKQYDRQIQHVGQTEYPETQALLKVQGVGKPPDVSSRINSPPSSMASSLPASCTKFNDIWPIAIHVRCAFLLPHTAFRYVWSAVRLQGKVCGGRKSALIYPAYWWRFVLLASMRYAACLSLETPRPLEGLISKQVSGTPF
jgi:hypothetical protein